MRYSNNKEVTLFILSNVESVKNEPSLWIFMWMMSACMHTGILFSGLRDYGSKEIIFIILLLVCSSFIYIYFLYRLIIFLLKKNNILLSMFINSIFLNLGVILNFLFLSSSIIVAYIYFRDLFNIYLIWISTMFFFSICFSYETDINEMLNMSISNFNSLIKGKGNKGNTIFFFKNTLPSFLNWLPDYIIYLPHCLGILLMLYAVMQRGSPESLENMIRGILILSAIFLYSEFCYFCIWVKYFIIKNKNKKTKKQYNHKAIC